VDAFRAAQKTYVDGGMPSFKPNFEESFRIGYWGRASDLIKVRSDVKEYAKKGYFKQRKFLPLWTNSWHDVMMHSASEPGLSSGLVYKDDILTLGGWVDGHSTMVLRNLGCEQVVYITRRPADPKSVDSNFCKGVASKLGMPRADHRAFFDFALDHQKDDAADPKAPFSMFERSVLEASAVWCTDWDKQGLDLDKQTHDGHTATLVVNPSGEDFFLKPQAGRGTYLRARKPGGPLPAMNGYLPNGDLLGCEIKTKGRSW
jgi:hypothetical protein